MDELDRQALVEEVLFRTLKHAGGLIEHRFTITVARTSGI